MMSLDKNNTYALIMAGGVGSRFWPVSTKEYPKQFHDMLGTGESLLQRTFKRLRRMVPEENILILTNSDYNALVKQQLPSVLDRNIVGEPAMRNTAPCILLSVLKIKQQNPNAVMIVAPSDSWIEDETAFVNDMKRGLEAAAQKDILVTLGIQPTFPNTGYGYIAVDHNTDEAFEQGRLYPVKRFTEKPDKQTAIQFFEQGNYLWNAGMFIWSVESIVKAFQTHLPEMYALFNQGRDQLNTVEETAFVGEVYPLAENISIDYGIMEKSNNVAVIAATFDWNDLGTWGSLYDKLPKDTHHNAVVNTVLFPTDSEGNMVYAGQKKYMVIDGIKDYIVVDKEDTLIIVPKSKEQEIKQIRAAVLAKK